MMKTCFRFVLKTSEQMSNCVDRINRLIKQELKYSSFETLCYTDIGAKELSMSGTSHLPT